MLLESRITWDKLSLELEMLNSEDPSSLVPILMGIHTVLSNSEAQDRSHRQMNMMTYELASRTDGYEESDRFHILNEYFFDAQSFQLRHPDPTQVQDKDYLIRTVIQNRSGHPLTIAIIYLHFASYIDLPVYLVRLKSSFILKWIRGGKCCYVDLLSNGKILNEKEILKIMNSSKCSPNDQTCEELDILPAKMVIGTYLNNLLNLYQRDQLLNNIHTIYNVILAIDPNNIKKIGERALLRKKLGYSKDAIADMKKYFSFVGQDQAPSEIQLAFYELNTLESHPQRKTTDLLH